MNPFFNSSKMNWYNKQELKTKSFICGYCGDKVSSNRGYRIGEHEDGSGNQKGGVFVCPNCEGPTFITPQGEMLPSQTIGNSVAYVPSDLNALYEEARRCTSHSSYTGCVLLCRKMLMNIAVAQGAKPGQRFIEYVNYLSDKGYTPPNGKQWVDHIRKKGNEANHEITLMNLNDAQELLAFTEMLLKFIYEFPGIISKQTTPQDASA